jgi:hypothetical protein
MLGLKWLIKYREAYIFLFVTNFANSRVVCCSMLCIYSEMKVTCMCSECLSRPCSRHVRLEALFIVLCSMTKFSNDLQPPLLIHIKFKMHVK